MSESAGLPLAHDVMAAEDVASLAEFQAVATKSGCVVCGSPSTTQPTDPRPGVSPNTEVGSLPAALPILLLCDEHWAAYHTDWLLLGWCVDHYAEALRYCERHQQNVPPL